ncbi:MAG: N-acetyl-gamma-glutamyl-phosphate reductase [Verrucomicrobiota bacterium]
MLNATKVAVVGASGYTGAQLLRLLLMHENVDLVCVTSRQLKGQPLESAFPRFRGAPKAEGLMFIDPEIDTIVETGAECAFLAVPHGVASEFAGPLLERGIRVIDLSADFRLNDADVYREFYAADHPAPQLLKEAIYGLPEFYADEIRAAKLVASPGCYPTSILVPLLPLIRERAIDLNGIVCSSMSGVSGAGKKAAERFLYVECNESVQAYGAPKHRHLSEIEQELSIAADEKVVITFIPHLTPVNAGICTSISAGLANTSTVVEGITEIYESVYADAPFVRLLGAGGFADTKNVVGTNFVDLGWHIDERTGRVLLSSAEDNLGKGAASQGVQSFNLMFDHEATAGLMNF